MKLLALLAVLVLTGCSTTLTGLNGTRFRTYANAEALSVTLPGATLTATRLNHSTPTRAGGSVIGTVGAAVVSGITATAAGGL